MAVYLHGLCPNSSGKLSLQYSFQGDFFVCFGGLGGFLLNGSLFSVWSGNGEGGGFVLMYTLV